MNPSSRKRTLRQVGLSSAIAVTVLASGVGVASASTHTTRTANPSAVRSSRDASTNAPPPMQPRGPIGIGGDVMAFTSSSITVANFNGTENTYAMNASTTVTDLRQSATTSSLAPGENVHIIVSSLNPSVASSIFIVPANIAGRVSAINGNTITVRGPNGNTKTIQVSLETTYCRAGASASLSDVSVGSFIFAEGTFGSSPTTIDAATVGIGMPGPGNGPIPSRGTGLGPRGTGPIAGGPPGTESEIGPHARGAATKK